MYLESVYLPYPSLLGENGNERSEDEVGAQPDRGGLMTPPDCKVTS